MAPLPGRSEPQCECPKMERYCPRHKYRWEYEQDEAHAHRVLDELGAPTVAAPFPGDMILSVAGRIRAFVGLEV